MSRKKLSDQFREIIRLQMNWNGNIYSRQLSDPSSLRKRTPASPQLNYFEEGCEKDDSWRRDNAIKMDNKG